MRTSISSFNGRFLLREIVGGGAVVLIEERCAAAALLLEVGGPVVVVGEGGGGGGFRVEVSLEEAAVAERVCLKGGDLSGVGGMSLIEVAEFVDVFVVPVIILFLQYGEPSGENRVSESDI